MKISVARNLKGAIGWQVFLRQLLKDMSTRYSVRVVDQRSPSDIHIGIIGDKRKKRSANIWRVDGIYYDRPRIERNQSIARGIKSADGVVYQSRWSMKMVHEMLRIKGKQEVVIHNGSIPFSNNIKINKRGYDKVWVACAHWRPNKRGEAIIDAFLCAKKKIDARVGLFFVGEYGGNPAEDVIFMGKRSRKEIGSILASSDYMVHICHIDSCPNSVVEGLLSGLPVLCNNIGGTPEIVQEDGIILPIDRPFSFKPVKSMKNVGSRSVDVELLSKGMLQMMQKKWLVHRSDLLIKFCSKKYYDFFKRITNGTVA